jgi:thiomorpholine-carboxylate dehydrogenase
MEAALFDLSAGSVTQPLRSVLSVPEHHAWFGLMPAVYRDVIGTKLVTVFPGNISVGLDSHQAVIQLFARDTGEPLALVGGRTITAWRTAAVSALATRELAPASASVLAILGSGVQARTHASMLARVREFREIRVWSRTLKNAQRFAEEVGAKVMSAQQAIEGADVIVTVTHSSEPVLRGEWIAAGAHINAVGAVGLHARELDDVAMRQSVVFVESREAAMNESGDIAHSGALIDGELGELFGAKQVRGAKRDRPQSRNTIYKSLGVAVEDVAAARLVYRSVLGLPVSEV